MNGINPYAYMQQVSVRMHELVSKNELEEVLDELEYLFEVIPPDMQDLAEQLISQLRGKLSNAKREQT
jgi:DNA-directed RNA polymerase subunit H (RpoH/RPB5)